MMQEDRFEKYDPEYQFSKCQMFNSKVKSK